MAIKIDDDGGDENNSPVAVIKASSKPTNNKHYDVRLVTLSCYVRVCVRGSARPDKMDQENEERKKLKRSKQEVL